MRIAHFTNVYKPVVNGVVTSVSTFREALTALGHTVFLFAPDAGDYVDEEPYVFRYPSLGLPNQTYPLAVPLSPSVDWLLPHLKLDVLHANHPFLLGQVAARKSQKLGIPLVFTYHTRYREYSHYVPAIPQSMVQDFIAAWMGDYLEKCHAVIVPSDGIAQMLRADYGLSEGVYAIPTGIDVEHWRKPAAANPYDPDTRVLISAGRLEEEKNWTTLVEAFAKVATDLRDLQLVILGNGSQRDALTKLAQERGVGERVQLPGTLPTGQLPAYFQNATLFCFASITETQGLVTLEAMASGLPVVAVHATGTDDVVLDGETGYLTDNDPDALAAAMRTLLDDQALRETMAGRAREHASSQDAAGCARRLLDVYGEAIERQRDGRRLIPGDPPPPSPRRGETVQAKVTFEDRLRRLLGVPETQKGEVEPA